MSSDLLENSAPVVVDGKSGSTELEEARLWQKAAAELETAPAGAAKSIPQGDWARRPTGPCVLKRHLETSKSVSEASVS